MKIIKRHTLLKPANNYVIDAPTPSNISYWWNVESLLGLWLGIQIIAGITLAIHYNPNVLEGFNSVEQIMRDVYNGWLIRYLHANTASAFFFLVYLHIGIGLYYGPYKVPRLLICIIVLIILFALLYSILFNDNFLLMYNQWSDSLQNSSSYPNYTASDIILDMNIDSLFGDSFFLMDGGQDGGSSNGSNGGGVQGLEGSPNSNSNPNPNSPNPNNNNNNLHMSSDSRGQDQETISDRERSPDGERSPNQDNSDTNMSDSSYDSVDTENEYERTYTRGPHPRQAHLINNADSGDDSDGWYGWNHVTLHDYLHQVFGNRPITFSEWRMETIRMIGEMGLDVSQTTGRKLSGAHRRDILTTETSEVW